MSDNPHPLPGCRRRHTMGQECLLGCSCPCHDWPNEMGEPCKTAEQMVAAMQRGWERAVADRIAADDDGTVTVSVPDASKTTREHFKLCLTCGWRRGKGGHCRC